MQDNSVKTPPPPPSDQILSSTMSDHAFALWGIDDVAYIKQVMIDGQDVWAIFSADGSTLGVVQERNLAFAAATQNDRVPVSVH